MKKTIVAIAMLCVAVACGRQMTRDELSAKLSYSMVQFLYSAVNYDSSKVKYRVLEVNFYEEKAVYDCDFKVRMLLPDQKDTIGYMKAVISKDFSTVRRMD